MNLSFDVNGYFSCILIFYNKVPYITYRYVMPWNKRACRGPATQPSY